MFEGLKWRGEEERFGVKTATSGLTTMQTDAEEAGAPQPKRLNHQ